MVQKRQFSLSHLLTEIALVAVGLGLLRQSILFAGEPASSALDILRVAALPAALGFFGAAIGGLFGRKGAGAVGAVALFFVVGKSFLPGPQVNAAIIKKHFFTIGQPHYVDLQMQFLLQVSLFF